MSSRYNTRRNEIYSPDVRKHSRLRVSRMNEQVTPSALCSTTKAHAIQ